MPDFNALLSGSVGAVSVLVVVLSLIVAGRLVPGGAYERECRKNDALTDQIPQNTAAVKLLMDAFADGRRTRG